MQSLATAAITIVVGLIVYDLVRFIECAFIDRINAQADTIVEVMDALNYYANLYSNFAMSDGVDQRTTEGSERLRRLASVLVARNLTIRWYLLWRFLRLVPARKDVESAAMYLTGLSNTMPPKDMRDVEANARARKQILRCLHLAPKRARKPGH